MDRWEAGLYNANPLYEALKRFRFVFATIVLSGAAFPAWAQDIYREAVVKAVEMRVFPAPDASTFPLATLGSGRPVKVYGKKGTRYYIRYDINMETRDGWVNAEDLQIGRLIRPQDTVGDRKLYPASVTAGNASAFEKPETGAKAIASFQKGEAVQVISQTGLPGKGWYRVRLEFLDGSVGSGWMEKRNVALTGGSTVGAAAPVSAEEPAAPQPQETEEKTYARSEGEPFGGLSAFFTPVLDVHRFGETQFRIGGAYEYPLGERFSLTFPVAYSLGNRFDSLQGGVGVRYVFLDWIGLRFFTRLSGLFERFSGRGVAFYSATVSAGAGFGGVFWGRFVALVEPVSFEITPYSSEDVPWFVRAQIVAALGWRW